MTRPELSLPPETKVPPDPLPLPVPPLPALLAAKLPKSPTNISAGGASDGCNAGCAAVIVSIGAPEAASADDGPAWIGAFEETALVLSLNVKCDPAKPAADVASDPFVIEGSAPLWPSAPSSAGRGLTPSSLDQYASLLSA
jgi:hypothetical protein